MSRFKKLSHTLWHCRYHIVWTPKYRLRILEGEVKQEVHNCIHTFSEQKKCKVMELNVQKDHIHLIVMVPPKLSISDYMGIVKGRTAIRVFNRFRKLKKKPYWVIIFGQKVTVLTLLKGVKIISTFLNDIKLLSRRKALKSYAKAYFSNDIRQ